MLRHRILAIITTSPGISAREIKARLRIGTGALYNALKHLKRAHAIEACAYGRYQAVAPRRTSSAAGAGQIADMRRLMAGR